MLFLFEKINNAAFACPPCNAKALRRSSWVFKKIKNNFSKLINIAAFV